MAQETNQEAVEALESENKQEAKEGTQTANEAESNTPSVDELIEQLAQERAEKQKLQNKYNKVSSEAAESKKALRARQTVEEREAAEQAEAQRLAEEEKEAMRKELNHIKAVAAYKSIQDEKTVELLIEAVSESDHSAIAGIIENEKQRALKGAKAEWQKSIPQPQVGAGEDSMSKEEILAIKDPAQRRQMIARNLDKFK